MKDPEDVKTEINRLIQNTNRNSERQPTKPPVEHIKFWFPTPETCTDVNVPSPLQREIHDEIPKFQQLKRIGHSCSMIDRETFLKHFHMENSVLTDNQKSKAEILVEFYEVLAKQIRRWSQH